MREHARNRCYGQFQISKEFRDDVGCRDWYAIQVRPRCEFYTAKILGNKGFQYFVPQYKTVRHWSDRRVEITLPMFPGYIFCKFDSEFRLPILTTAGVIRIICAGTKPAPIDLDEIEAIKQVVQAGCKTRPHPYLTLGDKVIIHHGPLTGLKGIVTGYRNRHLILSIGVVQRSIAVELDDCAILAAS